MKVKKRIGVLALLCSLLAVALYFGENAEASPPTGSKVKMSAYTMDGYFKGNFRGTLETGNWEYAVLGTSSDGVYLEHKGLNIYTIRSANPYTKGYDYWNFSSRGYIYLDKKSNATPFVINKRSDGYFYIFHNGVPLNTFFWGGGILSYITLGEASGYDQTKWKFQ
ncbi:hypothetical protein ACWOC1_14445 [Enterococcus quebecensis]|uniref:Uncharacterized protein n=1 Tax=Enterococcus quebecensis TaxID=903983 RepID=A0A1E5GUI1_9ENTE|nr:hypothetical protein [Enterococcus quebecensis]OEG16319.1 hypothetical protein BCR23_05365 [Enterococcus quebecensis]OJG74406.1 hypothetical protein RV12_GL002463 [Enterococcus quebecensis]